MKPASDIISRPILTEKASGLAEANKYVFEILPGADRAQVKTAIDLFSTPEHRPEYVARLAAALDGLMRAADPGEELARLFA